MSLLLALSGHLVTAAALIAGLLLGAMAAHLLVVSIAAHLHSDPPPAPGRRRLAVLVPANDEEASISRCVRSLLDQAYPSRLFSLTVIADNCSDRTAEVAAAAGALVRVRDEPQAPGKGRALRWAIDDLLAAEADLDAVVVVDADSVADPHLLAHLAAAMDRGYEAAQADYVIRADASAAPTDRSADLSWAGFLLFHRVRFAGLMVLGGSCSLVGNGMLLSAGLLRRLPWDAFSAVEDLEYTVSLWLAGARVGFAAGALVAGPPPAGRGAGQAQRLRWEGGRLFIVRTRLLELARAALARRDGRLAMAAFELSIPPLSLLAMLLAGGLSLVVVLAWLGIVPAWVALPWILALLALPAHVAVGLTAAGSPGALGAVVRGAPGFLVRKVAVYGRLLRGHDSRRWEPRERTQAVDETRPRRLEVAGVPIDPVDMRAALARILERGNPGALLHVCTVNMDFLARAGQNPAVRRMLAHGGLNLADGAPVLWLGRLLGHRLPGRVPGADLVPVLAAALPGTGSSLFLLGGEGGAGAAAATALRRSHGEGVVAGWYEPARAPVERMENEAILDRIRRSGADILLVALGHPKQEQWIERHRDRLGVRVAIGIGCSLDLIAGRRRRAPGWMRRGGLEWLYRLVHEPRRLGGRYLVDGVWLLRLAVVALARRPRKVPMHTRIEPLAERASQVR
ncbi:MAG: WecB/TagA/CpsF family glycosyltransferase [Candidatus Dormibacteraceae bacterium]